MDNDFSSLFLDNFYAISTPIERQKAISSFLSDTPDIKLNFPGGNSSAPAFTKQGNPTKNTIKNISNAITYTDAFGNQHVNAFYKGFMMNNKAPISISDYETPKLIALDKALKAGVDIEEISGILSGLGYKGVDQSDIRKSKYIYKGFYAANNPLFEYDSHEKYDPNYSGIKDKPIGTIINEASEQGKSIEQVIAEYNGNSPSGDTQHDNGGNTSPDTQHDQPDTPQEQTHQESDTPHGNEGQKPQGEDVQKNQEPPLQSESSSQSAGDDAKQQESRENTNERPKNHPNVPNELEELRNNFYKYQKAYSKLSKIVSSQEDFDKRVNALSGDDRKTYNEQINKVQKARNEYISELKQKKIDAERTGRNLYVDRKKLAKETHKQAVENLGEARDGYHGVKTIYKEAIKQGIFSSNEKKLILQFYHADIAHRAFGDDISKGKMTVSDALNYAVSAESARTQKIMKNAKETIGQRIDAISDKGKFNPEKALKAKTSGALSAKSGGWKGTAAKIGAAVVGVLALTGVASFMMSGGRQENSNLYNPYQAMY